MLGGKQPGVFRYPRPELPAAKRKLEDYETLEAGKAIVQHFWVLSVPPSPGQYLLEACYSPTPDEKWAVKKELVLECCDIDPSAIKDIIRLSHDARWMPPRVEILNLVTVSGPCLIYRELSSYGEVAALYRVCPLDAESKIAAVGKSVDEKHQDSQVWVVFNRQKELHFLRIDCATGKTLAHKVIGQDALAEPPPGDKK